MQANAIRTYTLLTKPGIIFGNLLTTVAGFSLGSSSFNIALFSVTLCGLTGVIASACICNNAIDREADRLMARTRHRSLAQGDVSLNRALSLAAILGVAGALMLAWFTNALSFSLSLLGFAGYVGLYSFSKYHTVHATLLGSLAGALPPVIGYTAASGTVDRTALLLFSMLVLWQMPHFFAIALQRAPEYAAASIPVLPVKRGVKATKVQMLAYLVAFVAVSLCLPRSVAYFASVGLAGGAWVLLAIQGFWCSDDRAWARRMFAASLGVILILCITMII